MKTSEKLSSILNYGSIEIMTDIEARKRGLLLDSEFKGNEKFDFESVIQPAKSFAKFVSLIYSVI